MEASQNKSDVTIQFLAGGLFIHFAGIFVLNQLHGQSDTFLEASWTIRKNTVSHHCYVSATLMPGA
jgi:hypothetical protein